MFLSQLIGFSNRRQKCPCLNCLWIVSRHSSLFASICLSFSAQVQKTIKYCWFTFLLCQILHHVAHYSSCSTSHLAVGTVVALLGPLAPAVSEGSWGRRCWDAPWGLAWWSFLNYCRSNPTTMTSNREVLCFTSVGNASVDSSGRF